MTEYKNVAFPKEFIAFLKKYYLHVYGWVPKGEISKLMIKLVLKEFEKKKLPETLRKEFEELKKKFLEESK